MAILTTSGRAALAAAITAQSLHLAWGAGDPAWDEAPVPEDIGTTALLNELGRRRVTQTLYCLPSADGELIVPSGRFTVSDVPTKYLYMRFRFDYEDAAGASIRELAIFSGTQLVAEVPPGKDYVVPADIAEPGFMLAVEHIPKHDRSGSVREQFEFVIQL